MGYAAIFFFVIHARSAIIFILLMFVWSLRRAACVGKTVPTGSFFKF